MNGILKGCWLGAFDIVALMGAICNIWTCKDFIYGVIFSLLLMILTKNFLDNAYKTKRKCDAQ